MRYIFLHPMAPSLVDELSTRSELFRRCWHERVVLEREGGERGFNHPKDGYLRFEQVGFALSGRPDLKLVILLPKPTSYERTMA